MKSNSNKKKSSSRIRSVLFNFAKASCASIPVLVAVLAFTLVSSANAYPATYSMILHSTITESKDYAYLKYHDLEEYEDYLSRNGLREIPEARYDTEIGEYLKIDFGLGYVNPEIFTNRDFGNIAYDPIADPANPYHDIYFSKTLTLSSRLASRSKNGWLHSDRAKVESGVLHLEVFGSGSYRDDMGLRLDLDSGVGKLYYEETNGWDSPHWTYEFGSDIFAYEVPELGIRVGDFSRVPTTTRVDSSTATLPALATLLLGMAFVRFKKARKN